MSPMFYVETYPGKKIWRNGDCWRWRAKAANREIIAHGECYRNYGDMLHTLHLLFGDDVEIRKMPK